MSDSSEQTTKAAGGNAGANLSAIFIRRPVMTTLLMGAIMAFGIVAYRQLPVSDLPNVDFPTLSVSASLPGASPETMAASVATPLERRFSTIAGLTQMSSSSTQGSTNVTLQFDLSRDLDAAAQDVQAAIAAASRSLPDDMPSPPTYQKVNPADSPILYLAITSDTLPLSELDEYAQIMLAQRISTVSGVAQVQVYGSQKYAVRVQLDPRALAARGVGIDEVTSAIQSSNVNLPNGTLFGAERTFTVESEGQLTEAEAYRPLIVSYRNGSPVRLQELGRVIDSVENDKVAAWFIDKRALVLAVQRQPGTNTVKVATAVRELLPAFRSQLPAAVNLQVLNDRSESIQESVHDVKFTLWLALCLVVLVIFLFLRNLSATLIPATALPLSIVGTFAVMHFLGYSLDNLSLMALTLAVGFVVDDAIVMLENVVRHMEMGKQPLQAALEGSREIGFTIISMTLSLAAVFLPVLFMGGLLGRLFHEFAVTIGMAVLISGVVSLSLTPMLCSRFLRPPKEEQHGRMYQAFERFFDGMRDRYGRGLRWSLDHGRVTMTILLLSMAATVWLFVKVPKGFLPSEDTGQIRAITQGVEGMSPFAMMERQQQLARIAADHPAVAQFMSFVGRGGTNSGILFFKLAPRQERPHVDAVIADLRQRMSAVPGIQVFLSNPPPIQLGSRFAKAQYEYTLQGSDTGELYAGAARLEARLRDVPQLTDVTSDLQIKNPQVVVNVDREKAARYDVTVRQIEDALYSAYGARRVSTIFAPENDYDVLLELLPEHQREPDSLGLLHVRSRSGAAGNLVPLGAVASFRRAVGPLTVTHAGQLPAVTLSFNLPPGVALGDALERVEAAARDVLPATITTSFQGTAQAFQDSSRGLGLLLVLSILVIYIVLGILYESFIHPLTILSALPLAGLGALATLMLFRTELSLYAFVGVIMLVGLVKKNGIMMVDFAVERRHQGAGARDAIYEASLVRFRPIMMTTMAALVGTLPIALGMGAGAESRRPLGLAVVGGLLFSQLLTLFVTPVFYVYMDGFEKWLAKTFPSLARGRKGAGTEDADVVTKPGMPEAEPAVARG
jgi:HAE1 family hydrophobic/amphiphilic exporter-1